MNYQDGGGEGRVLTADRKGKNLYFGEQRRDSSRWGLRFVFF